MKRAIQVTVIEFERGWGQRVDDYMICLTHESAEEFVVEFNKKNNEAIVPDWYMYASDNPQSIDLTEAQYLYVENTEDKRAWLSNLKTV